MVRLTKRTVLIITAIVCTLLLIFCCILTSIGLGASWRDCSNIDFEAVNIDKACVTVYGRIHIDQWTKADQPWEGIPHARKRMEARYFVFFVELIFACLAAFLIAYRLFFKNRLRWVELLISGAGTVFTFIAGVLEAWYASGDAIEGLKVSSWAAAAAFLFLTTLFFALDFYYTWRADWSRPVAKPVIVKT